MKVLKGNLLDMADNGDFDVIIHGCNCFHTMGGGIAYQIAQRYPEAYDADKETIHGDRDKLGTYSSIFHHDSVTKVQFTIINTYTQYFFGKGLHVSYDAVFQVFAKFAKDWNYNKNIRIGYPQIGAGLAGGNWRAIAALIDEALDGMNHTVVEYKPS